MPTLKRSFKFNCDRPTGGSPPPSTPSLRSPVHRQFPRPTLSPRILTRAKSCSSRFLPPTLVRCFKSCCGTDHGRSEGVLKFHRDLAVFSDVIYERWTKACNAGPSGMPDARIDDTGRSRIQEFVRQSLRGRVAVRIETFDKTGIAMNIVKFSSEICQEI